MGIVSAFCVVCISRSLIDVKRLSGARRVGLVSSYLFKEVARSAHGPPTQRAGVPGEMAHDPWGHRFSPACLTSLLILGRVAAYCLAEAGHDPGKCVQPELIERGG